MALFQSTVIQKYINAQDQTLLKEKWEAYQAHFHDPSIQENIRNAKEEQYQEGFLRDLFVKILGYTLNPATDYNLTTELKNVKDSKKADGGIIVKDKVVGVIELKGTNTTDLSKIEAQAFGYKNNQSSCTYVITSNFEKIRFYIDNAIEHENFNLFKLTEDDFSLLYLCLAYENIKRDIPKKVKNDSHNQEDITTKQLYRDYSVFKRELYNNLVELNPKYEPLLLFKKSQKLLDRFLFLFFAEDRHLLPPNSVRLILKQWKQLQEMDAYSPLYKRFKKYFGYLNTGHKGKQYDVYPYNGGLFRPDEVLDKITIEDDLLYKYTLKLSEYDFDSEVDVNILGHIFENSLNEIEEIQTQLEENPSEVKISKRKKDGVFYTPKYITKYIVENTIGKLCEEKKTQANLVEEDYNIKRQTKTKKDLLKKLNTYRDWLLQITVVDPACGSGAFLNEALNYLIAEHQFLDELETKLMGGGLVFPNVENSILENNLFGVDINNESVEIAKLSLWLRTAQPNRKLNDLSNNIKCGNSLIDDPEVAGKKAFNWEKEFPQVFAKGGFDVVIGNPPYVSVKALDSEIKKYLAHNYETSKGQFDLYTIFFEKGYSLIKNDGILSFISSNTFISNKDFLEFRKFILEKSKVLEIINLGETVFEDANLDVAILSFKKSNEKHDIKIIQSRDKFDELDFSFINQNIFLKDNYEMRINVTNDDIKIISKMRENSILLEEIIDLPRGIEFGSNSEKIFNENKDDAYKIIFGKNIDRYAIDNNISNYCFFEDNKSVFKSLEYYTNEKIFIQRIRNLSLKRRIIAAYDDNKHLCTNTLRMGVLKNELFDLKFILSLINSSLINYLFLKLFFNKDIYSYQLKQIPIKEASKQTQEIFNKKANQMLALNKELQEISSKLQRSLQRQFPEELEKLSNKLHDWYELSYANFIKELKKKKIKLSLSQEAEWEEYFLSEQQKATSLTTQIHQTDKKIDQMVYELYGLSEEEIEIVENN
ncbi:N-6 DNA methylase [Psychroflexus sp. YR1-1]|uniref:site-specific DNA-methyltransferase (adenine-specific) n=1 Tax=Psychroflexus aurantiacus TaxID=2709310 RepID=A0A6B3QYU4_9FLAO|nr:DNA methyltransferase [Psychroflexus aurantiacus]NEV93453.1 N-6 DNA methylase [Psychroflexus aurantiacus]